MENNETQTTAPVSTRALLDQISDKLDSAGTPLFAADEQATGTLAALEHELEGLTNDGQELLSVEQVHGIRNGARDALKELNRLSDVIDNLKQTLTDIKDLAQERLDA